MTTVWIYVDTNKDVGDPDHLKVFASPEAADDGSRTRSRGRGVRLRGDRMTIRQSGSQKMVIA
jgi:hypothetical protein